MAILDKLSNLASAAGEKAGNAIESGKLAIKIKEEERKIDNLAEKIGKIIIMKLDGGEEMDPEIKELYDGIIACREEIARAKEEQEKE